MEIHYSSLKHGDILLFKHDLRPNAFERGIRLAQGNQYVHAGMVANYNGNPKFPRMKFVLEQLVKRQWTLLVYYQVETGVEVLALRPKWEIPEDLDMWFSRVPYGYMAIADSIANHVRGHLDLPRKIMFQHLSPIRFDCSGLVATALRAPMPWPERVTEPDDFLRLSPQLIETLGNVSWGDICAS